MTSLVDTAPRLSELSEAERSARFARLQERLVPLWGALRLNQAGESIVVVPSVSPDATQTGTVLQALEERMLFLLLLLRKPRMRVIYVTGRPVPTEDAPRRAGDSARLIADSRLARERLGWRPELDDLRQIVRDAWNWECSAGRLKRP